MSLKKYNCCDEKHADEFQYVCLKDKRVFCLKCWYKVQHYRHCQSSRCGQYHKIAHLVLNRGLEYKNSILMEHMSSNQSTYEALRVQFLQLNFKVTETLKDFVQQKMQLLFWGMVNQLLRSRCGPQTPQGYYKFDSYCTEMLNIIKSTDTSMKQEYLQSAIGAYFDINHQLEGELNGIRTNRFTNSNHKQYEINDILDKTKNELNDFLKNIKMGFRKAMDDQLKKYTKNVDPAVTYPGVSFKKITPETQCFRKREQYSYLNLVTQKCARITSEDQELHMGFHMNVATLQANPEQLLHAGKCLLKERLFQFYEGISTIKTVFPYKYAYPISTTLSYDQDYEQMLINLERAAINPAGKSHSFLSSMTLVVMGRDVVVIRFSNTPRFQYSRKIYNYRPERREYYAALITMFDLQNTPIRSTGVEEEIVYSQEMTDVQLAYCNFRVAYENIFMYDGEDLIFEGEKIMANRGAEQFSEVIEKWRKHARIDLPFSRSNEEVMKDVI